MKPENIKLIEEYYNFLRENNILWSNYDSYYQIRTKTEQVINLENKRDMYQKRIIINIDLFKQQKNEIFLNSIFDYINIHYKIQMYKNLHKNIFVIFNRIMIEYNYTEENLINLLCEEYYNNNDEQNYIGILKGIQCFKIKKYEQKIIQLEERYKKQELKGKKEKQYYSNLRGNINHLIKCRNDLKNDYEIVNHYLGKYQLNRKLSKLPQKQVKIGVKKI